MGNLELSEDTKKAFLTSKMLPKNIQNLYGYPEYNFYLFAQLTNKSYKIFNDNLKVVQGAMSSKRR